MLRNKRANAGNRMHLLLQEGLDSVDKDEFKLIENDDSDFDLVDDLQDEYDSDFDKYANEEDSHEKLLDNEGSGIDHVLIADEKRRAAKVNKQKWKRLLQPKAKQQETEQKLRPNKRKSYNVESETDFEDFQDKKRPSTSKKQKKTTSKEPDHKTHTKEVPRLTQEDRLREAAKTEIENLNSLAYYQKHEEEKLFKMKSNFDRKQALPPGEREVFYSTTDKEKREARNYIIKYTA